MIKILIKRKIFLKKKFNDEMIIYNLLNLSVNEEIISGLRS